MHGAEHDLDDRLPGDVVPDRRRLAVAMAVHAHPDDHLEERPRACRDVLIRQRAAGDGDGDDAREVGDVAAADGGLVEAAQFGDVGGATIEQPDEAPVLRDEGE